MVVSKLLNQLLNNPVINIMSKIGFAFIVLSAVFMITSNSAHED